MATPVQIQCPFLYTLLLNYLSFPSICLVISLLPFIIYFKLPITRTLFDFPRRFELSGVDCSVVGGGGVTPHPPVRTGTQATLSLLLLRVSHFKRYYLRFRFSHNFFFKNNANILLNSKLSTFINEKIGRCSFFKGILERLEKGYILISKILNMTKNISNKCINAETVNCFFF